MAVTHLNTVQKRGQRETATAVANAATVNALAGVITSSTANLAADTAETLTVTCDKIITTNAMIHAWVVEAGTGGVPMVAEVQPTAVNTFTVVVRNIDGTNAMTSTYQIGFRVVNEG